MLGTLVLCLTNYSSQMVLACRQDLNLRSSLSPKIPKFMTPTKSKRAYVLLRFHETNRSAVMLNPVIYIPLNT